jgi:hypothetical protein
MRGLNEPYISIGDWRIKLVQDVATPGNIQREESLIPTGICKTGQDETNHSMISRRLTQKRSDKNNRRPITKI